MREEFWCEGEKANTQVDGGPECMGDAKGQCLGEEAQDHCASWKWYHFNKVRCSVSMNDGSTDEVRGTSSCSKEESVIWVI